MNLGFLMEALTKDHPSHIKEQLHRSLVREVIRMRIDNRPRAVKFIRDFMQLHPDSKLENDVVAEWLLGNRGEVGDWRQDKKDAK